MLTTVATELTDHTATKDQRATTKSTKGKETVIGIAILQTTNIDLLQDMRNSFMTISIKFIMTLAPLTKLIRAMSS